MKQKILFTGGGGAGNEAIWRILSEKYDLYFADALIENIDSIIPVKNSLKIPIASNKNFILELKNICKKYEIDVLVPSVDEELLQLSQNKGDFSCEIFLPETRFIKLMLKKYDCMKSLGDSNLSHPITYKLVDHLLLDFPIIVKPNTGRGSNGVLVVNSTEELHAYKVLYKTPDKDLIAQELIKGQEFTVLVSADSSGELNAIVPVKVHCKKGVTISAEIDMNHWVIEYAKQFHEKYKVSSIYNIQCILTRNGGVYPFEVNPRISTTFCMSLAAGFDPFEIFYRDNAGLSKLDVGVSLKRTWKNTLEYL
jgi:carbamoyl-phosphate synthase large subunit